MNNVNPARPAKGKGHFNIIDILIIIFILLVAGGAVFLFIFTGTGAADKTAYDIEYQLWYDQQRPEFSDRIKAGDKVYDLSGEYALGEVVAVDVRPCIVDSYDKMSEQMIGTIMPDRYSILLP